MNLDIICNSMVLRAGEVAVKSYNLFWNFLLFTFRFCWVYIIYIVYTSRYIVVWLIWNDFGLYNIHLHSSMLHMQLHNCTVQIHNCTLQIHLTTVFFLIYYIYIIQCYICNCTIVQFKYTMYFANTLITENTINSILLVLYVKICVKLILIIHV